MHVIDGTNMIFGRMASQVSKKLLQGEEIHIVNAEKLVLIGKPEQIAERYFVKRSLQNKGNPENSPKWPKIPHLLVKRMLRGMLPKKSSRGRDALKRLKVYEGNPKKLEQNLKIKDASFDGIAKHMTIGNLCGRMEYKG